MSPTLGETLRKLRNEKGVSLEQAAQGTHIRLAYLKALELDERHLLPSPVQGKGFLRVYADYLGTPVRPLLDLWEGKAPLPAGEVQPKPVEQPVTPEVEPLPEPVRPAPVWVEPTDQPLTASQEMFRQIGQELRRQRELISMSLPDVERFTRLRMHYLAALEEGRLDDLPSPVQGRGMLSNYAHFLHLDSEALLLRYAEALQARRLERMGPAPKTTQTPIVPRQAPKKTAAQAAATMTWRRLISPDLMIGGTLFILLLGFIIWGSARVIRLNAQTVDITPPSIAEMLQDTPGLEEALTPTGPVLAASPSPPSAEGSDAEAAAGEDLTITETAGPPPSDAVIQVYVVASQRAFLRITADGEIAFNGRTTPGGAYSFSADEQLELLTGNAGGLQVFYQQEDLGILGGVGDVASRIFTAEGITTATPAALPTEQPAAAATTTLQPSPTRPAATITPFLP